MRSVRVERKPPRGRIAKSGRNAPRANRVSSAAPKSFGRRRQPSDNFLARAFQLAKTWAGFRRPMLSLTAILVGAAFLAALIIGGYVGRTINRLNSSFAALVDDAGFGISQVHLAGNRRVPPESILAALGFEPGQSIFAADIHAARARLEKLDWVASADVKRRYPDDISVRIIEKRPFALWQSPVALYVVERNGNVITDKGVEEFHRLPLLLGDGGSNASDIVDAVSQHRAVSARVRAYERVSQRRWNLVLDDGVVVKLSDDHWQKDLDHLEFLIVEKGILENDVVEIDLRSAANDFFVLRGGEKKNEPRGNAA